MSSIVSEKLDQAVGILNELDVDAWLTFVRESADSSDSVLPIIVGHHFVWPTAFILTKDGRRIAICGKHDDASLRADGLWTDVRTYVQRIRETLVAALDEINPSTIAINYSLDDSKADGLSHGMYELLRTHLSDRPFGDRFISAGEIISKVRTRKTATEVARIREAIATTDEIFEIARAAIRVGQTERALAQVMHAEVGKRGRDYAWNPAGCPIVNTGPASPIGHAEPTDLKVEPGHVVHIDFGVKQNEFCSDIQRCWYVPRDGENEPPEPVCRAFGTVVTAIQAAATVVRPGVAHWEVDAVARQVVVDAGYPEYQHATGHHVGRAAHDGGGILGPQWERYGQLPYQKIEPGNVFTLELGIADTGAGYIGLEEMVLVTNDGCEFLTTPQTELEVV